MTSHTRWFAWFTLLYPARFRERYAEEILEFFDQEIRGAPPNLRSRLRIWSIALSDTVRTAVRLRLQSRSPRTRPTPQPQNVRRRRMDSLRQDLVFAFRTMRKRPLFTAIILLTLAVGVGANSAIYTVVKGVVLRPLPYEDPDRLVMVWEHNVPRGNQTNVVSPANFFTWSEETAVFTDLTALTETSETMTVDEVADRIGVVYATASFFQLTGTTAALGRVFHEADDRPGAPLTAVLTHDFWRRRFNSDLRVIGRTVSIEGRSAEIVGVLPAGFKFRLPVTFNSTGQQDMWMPQRFDEAARIWRGRWLQVVGRLAPGVSLEQAQSRMEALAAGLELEFPNAQAGWTINVVRLLDQVVGDVKTPLIILFGAVVMVLLIACANVANLLLSKTSGRKQEIAVRTALGAARGRVLQQVLTESIVLAVCGGVLGLLLAFATINVLVTLGPANLPRLDEVGIDLGVTLFTLGVSVLTGVLFGALPALRLSRSSPGGSLTASAARAGTTSAHLRTRNTLVVVEFALSLILLVGAGVLIRSFVRLTDTNVGFDTDNLLTAQLDMPSTTYPSTELRVQAFDQLVDRLATLPGVASASAITWLPLAPGGSATSFWINDRPVPQPGEFPVADLRWVHPGYHQTMGIPLIAGRLFDERDTRASPLAVIVSRYVAEEFWPGQDPLGKTIGMEWGDTLVAEIIGVVGDVRHNGPTTEPRSKFYWNHRQFQVSSAMTVVLRTTSAPLSLVNPLRAEAGALSSAVPVYNVRTMESYVNDVLASARFSMLALGTFAGIAILLACIGIFGVMSYTVNQQRREIGIRIALGARGSAVTAQIVKQGATLTGIAVVIGVAGGLFLSRFLEGMVYQISPADPVTYIVVSVLLIVVSLGACYVPAVRASRVDPVTALRTD